MRRARGGGRRRQQRARTQVRARQQLLHHAQAALVHLAARLQRKCKSDVLRRAREHAADARCLRALRRLARRVLRAQSFSLYYYLFSEHKNSPGWHHLACMHSLLVEARRPLALQKA
jgi:hypothetical protein